MLRASMKWVGRSSLLLVAAVACSDRMSPPPPVPLPAWTAGRGFAVPLAVDSFVSVDPILDSGCVIFPANSSAIDSAEYLLVPQSAAGSPGVSSSFLLLGDTVHTPVAAMMASLTAQSPAQPFHDFLRQGERLRWYGLAPQSGAGAAPPSAVLLAGPPTVGGSPTLRLWG